jgi:hypothetical protein
MIRIPRIGGTAVFLAAMPWRPAFKVRATGSQLKFFVHHRDLIGRHIAKYGTHEPVPTRWLENYLTHAPKGIFIDVGANLGWHAVHAARHPSVSGRGMIDRLLGVGFEPFGLDKEGRIVPVAAEKLRAFKGQMDLVMMTSAGR